MFETQVDSTSPDYSATAIGWLKGLEDRESKAPTEVISFLSAWRNITCSDEQLDDFGSTLQGNESRFLNQIIANQCVVQGDSMGDENIPGMPVLAPLDSFRYKELSNVNG